MATKTVTAWSTDNSLKQNALHSTTYGRDHGEAWSLLPQEGFVQRNTHTCRILHGQCAHMVFTHEDLMYQESHESVQ